MFDPKNIFHYLIAFSIIVGTSYFANKYKDSLESNTDEYDLIKKYLLNESPLYGYNKPKLWIHTKYEINARKWKSFYSRNTTDLNQPYIHLTVKTIINHCGNDFNICLIDDEVFSKLIPTWDIDMNSLAEPMKSQYRQLGLLKLIYYYGGMVVPNSFICLKNLKELYEDGVRDDKPFICENVNYAVNLLKHSQRLVFTPDLYFFGSLKNNDTIKQAIEYLKLRNMSPHFTSEMEFTGDTQEWFLEAARKQQINIIGGEMVGVKTQDRKAILVDDLMEENYLDLNPRTYGIYIPEEEILKRVKFQWFAVIDSNSLLETRTIVAKYLKASIVDSCNSSVKPNDFTNRGMI